MNINNVNYRSSGLYTNENFFKEHDNIFDFTDEGFLDYDQYENLKEENNFEDEVQEYRERLYREAKNVDDEEMRREVSYELTDDLLIDKIIEDILIWNVHFEPKIFNKEIAKKCGLVAFKHNDKELLALAGAGMDLSPRLDAYQALVDNTIDEKSTFFSQPSYFKHVVGESVAEEVKRAITKSK